MAPGHFGPDRYRVPGVESRPSHSQQVQEGVYHEWDDGSPFVGAPYWCDEGYLLLSHERLDCIFVFLVLATLPQLHQLFPTLDVFNFS